MEFYITVLLLAVCIALLVANIIISRRKNGTDPALSAKTDEVIRRLGEESERSRRESRESADSMRREMEDEFDLVKEKIASSDAASKENDIKLAHGISDAFSSMKLSMAKQSAEQTSAIHGDLEKIRQSNEASLEQMRMTVDEKLSSTLAKRLDSSFRTVSEQLENVYKSIGEMKELSSEMTNGVSSLTRVMTNVKARGTWAEVQLGNILDQTIPGMYVKNFAPRPSGERVEYAVRIPSSDSADVFLPIDSKFPLEDYARLCEASRSGSAGAAEDARKALENRVFEEGKTVAKYINVPVTTPFAVLYLATEGLYAEVLSSRNGVAEKLQQINVMIAGPATITALLNSLALGMRTVAINEKANEVRKLLSVTRVQYDKFTVLLEKARKKIDEAGNALDEAQHRNQLISGRLRNVELIDKQEAERLLGIEETNPYNTKEDI